MGRCIDRDFGELAERYSSLADPVIRRGRAFPAAIEPRLGGAIEARAVSEIGSGADGRLLEGGQIHLKRQIRANPRMHDGAVLALESALGDELELRHGSYFGMVATCDSLRAEFEEGHGSPLRDLAESLAAPDPLRLGAGRVAAVGVTVAVTCRASAGRLLLIGRRRSDLAADPGRWDVAPSGMLEPIAGGSEPIRENAIRETQEELGNVLSGAGGMRMLGVAFDLLRLKPDVILELELPPERFAGLSLSESEFELSDSLDLSHAGIERFWSGHGPRSLTATAAGTVALLEMC